jgi:hypothetical protein
LRVERQAEVVDDNDIACRKGVNKPRASRNGIKYGNAVTAERVALIRRVAPDVSDWAGTPPGGDWVLNVLDHLHFHKLHHSHHFEDQVHHHSHHCHSTSTQRSPLMMPLPQTQLLDLSDDLIRHVAHFLNPETYLPDHTFMPFSLDISTKFSSDASKDLRNLRSTCRQIRDVVPLDGLHVTIKGEAGLNQWASEGPEPVLKAVR